MKRICPPALRYAVVRIDPVAMVEHLQDPDATAAARAICPKKYLVYLDNAVDIALPTSEWFRFQISPIGTTLRPEEPERGITANMAIPIFPNEEHPEGRPFVRPSKPFPFSHCYHWFDNLAVVRVRRIPEMYDDSAAIRLSSLQHIRMEKAFAGDCSRVNAFMESPEPIPEDGHTHSAGAQGFATQATAIDVPAAQAIMMHPAAASPPCHPRTPETGSPPLEKGRDPRVAQSPKAASGRSRPDRALEDLLRMDVLSLTHDDDVAFLPLVDLWFELEEHLSEDEIPSPLGFHEERDAIRLIIRDARERKPVMRVPRRNGELGADSGLEVAGASDCEELVSASGDEAAPPAPAEPGSRHRPATPLPQSPAPRLPSPEPPVPPPSDETAEFLVEFVLTKFPSPKTNSRRCPSLRAGLGVGRPRGSRRAGSSDTSSDEDRLAVFNGWAPGGLGPWMRVH